MEENKCFACGKAINPFCDWEIDKVKTEDGQKVRVGGSCYRSISASSPDGWQPPKGGPKLYLITPN